MAGKNFILEDMADFAPGYFENTVMEADGVQLGHTGQGYHQSGTYTSPPYACEGFFALIPSWNAEVPPGTSVEMQVRVCAGGKWSCWFSFGVWSPYRENASQPVQQDELALVEEENLNVKEGSPAADTAQMRVWLHSNSSDATPRIHLLAISTNATSKYGRQPPAFGRVLQLPGYSARTRDPAIAGSITSLTTLVMMMNRWGTDLLPEEMARISYDSAAGNFSNVAFLCAAAGCYGFHCHAGYSGMADLRRQVWLGRAVAARVQYRAQALGEQEAPAGDEDDTTLPPLLEGASVSTPGHLVAVHGFSTEDGVEMILFSNPAAEHDEDVVQRVPFSHFAKMYTGLAVFLRPGPVGAGKSAPRRKPAQLVIEENTVRLLDGREEIVPAKLDSVGLSPATVCYTLSDGIAYASAAQRRFYYPKRDESGALRIDRAAAANRRMTFYVFGPAGRNWVAEKQMEE